MRRAWPRPQPTRAGTRDRAQLQCEPFDDFEADGMTFTEELFQVADATAEALAYARADDLQKPLGEFSNIAGLGQIRFPKANIASKFEEIRLVLEREGLLEE
jgi:hypothetical protein